MTAGQIAVVSAGEMNDEMENMYLNFSVGNEVYGIEIRYVLQIIGMQKITEMPEMPPFMKGFVDLRGSVIPVVSMRLRFGKLEENYTDRTGIIVVKIGDKESGLIVDTIQETITIEPEQISAPPMINVENEENTYVKGIAKLSGDCNVILINVCKLFGEIHFN